MYKEGLNFNQISSLENKLCGIYRLSIKEHSYIGSSKNLRARLSEHRVDLKYNQHINSFLQNNVNKHGLDSVVIDIIELCEPCDRIARESFWIEELKSDMNFQNPIDKTLSELSRKKISQSLKKVYDSGERVHYFAKSKIECYDYFGEYITTYNTKEEAAKACGLTVKDVTECLRAYKHGTKSNGSSIGKSVHGYRFRYSDSKIPILKFHIHPKRVGQIINFYYKSDNGDMKHAFSSVKDCWEFFTEHCRDKEITIIPVLKSRESWDLRQEKETDNHNGSVSEME